MPLTQPRDALAPTRPAPGAGPSRKGDAPSSPRRWPLIVAAVIGIGLIAAPAIFGMFSRAPKGATMLADFKPFMTTARLDGFQADIAQIDAAAREVDHSGAGRASAAYQDFSAQWPTIHTTMSDLLDDVQGNLGNYQAVAALPSFTLFPWFFVIPGVLIAAAAALALLRPARRRATRIALAVLGVGLILAPAAFQMFSRAPQGGRMMSAFRTIETTDNVSRIQGYFSTMASGQGAIRLDVVPALERSGLTHEQVATKYPAVTHLNDNWVHILNDMTPMIGAMSDNVVNYQAIAALPPFPLFPWFFLIPGVLVVGLAVASGARARSTAPSEGVS